MSLKGEDYETLDEINTRLNSSIVLYDGRPVYIRRISLVNDPGEGGGKDIVRVYAHPLPYNGDESETFRKYISSKKFDLTPFPMGYVNYAGEVNFVSRTTRRQYCQGLNSANCSILNIAGEERGPTLTWAQIVGGRDFNDSVMGVFPDFPTAMESIFTGKAKSVAISRGLALKHDTDLGMLFLYHRGQRCGFAVKGDKSVTLPEKFKFLREEFEEHRIPLKAA